MSLLNEANGLKEVLIGHRRYLHERPELHIDLPVTVAYVKEKLAAMGYEPVELGKGVVVIAGGKKPGKTFLVRADMDALPIVEENNLPFKSKNENMHACGHDFHTSMLLGAAQLLKNHEDEIEGAVKLMFQPAEETLTGAKLMIEAGVLENPKVDAGMMMHVLPAMPFRVGTILVPPGGIGSSAADWFHISIQGKGGHGAMPQTGVDPLNVISHLHLALQEISAREISSAENIVLTVGQMHGGNTSNVIPDTAFLSGTIRSFDQETREFVKKRLVEISDGIAATFRAAATVVFEKGCPCVINDADMSAQINKYTTALLGDKQVIEIASLKTAKVSGSEDFAYISEKIPVTSLNIGVGSTDDESIYPLHHPKVQFDEDALPVGAAVYANSAMEWLKHNK